jgi:hypothetical protein
MKKICLLTLLFVVTFSISMAAQLPNYTLADVAKHATPADCWMVLNNTEVYNVTAFLSLHPAGAGPMTPFCGANATTAFNNVGHSTRAVGLEATYLIGNLVASSISVTISPTTASLNPGQQQSFTANVANSTMGVKWTATSVGTIDQNGNYTAVNPGTGTVTATSVEDATKSASATVTVTSIPPTGGVAVTVTPGTSTVSVGATQQFTAKVTGSTNGVTWTATGAVGTVDNKGMFTATKAGQGYRKQIGAGVFTLCEHFRIHHQLRAGQHGSVEPLQLLGHLGWKVHGGSLHNSHSESRRRLALTRFPRGETSKASLNWHLLEEVRSPNFGSSLFSHIFHGNGPP